MDEVWSERNTTPAKIEAALRRIVSEHYHSDHPFVPARVLNVVVVVDAEFRGEIENRFERVGRYHPSRLVLCAVEDGRDTIVDPLLVTDLATMVWAPHGHREAVDSLRRLAQIVLVDTQDEPDVSSSLARVEELSENAYVVDLAWLRSTPWRERVAAAFDPPQLCSAPRAARAGSSARACARRCCAIRPTGRRSGAHGYSRDEDRGARRPGRGRGRPAGRCGGGRRPRRAHRRQLAEARVRAGGGARR